MVKRFLILALALSSAAFLASCNRNPLEVKISRCPAVAIIGDIGSFSRFQDDVRLQENLLYTASINDVLDNCREGGQVEDHLSFDVTAQMGPAFRGKSVELVYFIAILKDNSQLVSKKTYKVTLDFDRSGFAIAPQRIDVSIPSIEQARRYNYELLVGFQAEPNDVYFNMIR